jgi:uncharacterized Tic20 family protein
MDHAMPNTARFRDPDATSSDRKKAVALHLLGLSSVVWIPVVPSLVLWLITRDDSGFVRDHGKEAINFQISCVIYFVVGLVTLPILIGGLILAGTGVLALVGMVMASIAAKDSEYFRYPMCLRLIK